MEFLIAALTGVYIAHVPSISYRYESECPQRLTMAPLFNSRAKYWTGFAIFVAFILYIMYATCT